MSSLRGWRLAALLLLTVVVLAGAWLGWTAYQVNQDLKAAVSDASTLRTALEDGDEAQVDDAIAQLTDHSRSAADRTQGATWSALTKLPVVGDDADGVALAADVLADLTDDGLSPLTTVFSDLETLAPREGSIDVDGLEALQPRFASSLAAFEEADARLATLDPMDFQSTLRARYRELAREVDSAAKSLRAADTALAVMPTILGADGPRDYLLVFQNNAEVRATGGLPGAVAVLSTEEGRTDLTRQVTGISFGRVDESPLPLTDAEVKIYGEELGLWFVDANFTPDFPRTAALMKARWEQEYPESVDGVFSIDPVALSYLLEATGPVTVDGVELTADNVVDELLHGTYLRFEDTDKQDAFFQRAAKRIFDAFTDGVDSPEDLFSALHRGVVERRILVHSFEPEVQGRLEGETIAGELVTDAADPHPQVGVYLNDATGAKMSYFLRHDVRVTSTYCKDEVQGLVGKAHLLSDAPDDAADLPDYITGAGTYGTEPGSQLVLIRLYGPVGGTITQVQLNSKPLQVDTVLQDGRPVVTLVAQLEPGRTVDFTWRMTSGVGQTGDVQVGSTPSVLPVQTSSLTTSACRP